MTEQLDCSPVIAAKLARCEEIARYQVRYGKQIASYTKEDTAIMDRMAERLLVSRHPHGGTFSWRLNLNT